MIAETSTDVALPDSKSPIARLLARATSSSISIGVATTFIAFVSLLSFLEEPSGRIAGWQSRSTIAPNETWTPARLPGAAKRV